MSEKIKKNEKAKKQTWRAGNMLYPVPAVMVSCARKGEKPNIITVAWAGTVCSDPAMVSISVRKERYSHDIIKETGEFVINLTTRKLARATDYCGVKSGRDVDKFADMHLTAVPSVKIEAPARSTLFPYTTLFRSLRLKLRQLQKVLSISNVR